MTTLYGSAEVSKQIGCSREYVQRLARRHEIGQKKGGVWLFTPGDLSRLKRKARPPGQPPKRRRR